MFVSVCFVAAGVLPLVFRGKILGCVRRRTTTEPFTKDVVIDHERSLGELKTSTVVVLTTNHVQHNDTHHRPHHKRTHLLATTTRNTTLNRIFYRGHDPSHLSVGPGF